MEIGANYSVKGLSLMVQSNTTPLTLISVVSESCTGSLVTSDNVTVFYNLFLFFLLLSQCDFQDIMLTKYCKCAVCTDL